MENLNEPTTGESKESSQLRRTISFIQAYGGSPEKIRETIVKAEPARIEKWLPQCATEEENRKSFFRNYHSNFQTNLAELEEQLL